MYVVLVWVGGDSLYTCMHGSVHIRNFSALVTRDSTCTCVPHHVHVPFLNN